MCAPTHDKAPGDDGLFKFVRVNGEYRFTLAMFGGRTHKSLVGEGETAESAGTMDVREDCWKMADWRSMTLGIGVDGQTDIDNLTELLGKPYRDRWS